MNQSQPQHKPIATSAIAAPEKKAAPVGRVFKFPFKGIPVVDAAMQARLEAAARAKR